MHHFPHRLAATFCAAGLAAFSLTAFAADATILHVFGGKKDGDGLSSPLIIDAAGRLFEITRLDSTFDIQPSVDAAVARVRVDAA